MEIILDFTYIDDAINLNISLIGKKLKFEIFNICSSRPMLITKILKK